MVVVVGNMIRSGGGVGLHWEITEFTVLGSGLLLERARVGSR